MEARFERDGRISVVKISDVVVPQRLSRIDNFHPDGAAYDETARRIADILVEMPSAG